MLWGVSVSIYVFIWTGFASQAHNILVEYKLSGESVAKIADLGTAVKLKSKDALLYEPVGTSGYTGKTRSSVFLWRVFVLLSLYNCCRIIGLRNIYCV